MQIVLTIPEALALLQPLVKAGLRPVREQRANPLPSVTFSTSGVRYMNADLREANADGVSIFSYSSCHFVLWGDISGLRICPPDADGWYQGTIGEDYIVALPLQVAA